jgi:alkylation response protein AidB-like acyl-CoA dehydrogenase
MTRYTEVNRSMTEEQVALKESVHAFCKEVLRPASLELDKIPDPDDVIKKGSIFWQVMKKAYGLGYHAATIPEEHGGLGLGPL